MTILVPFDGSELARTALKRAETFADSRDEELVVLTVVPDDKSFAVERGWIESGATYDIDRVCQQFERTVTSIVEDATFRCEIPTDSDVLTATATDDITRTIRQVAGELDVSVIFIGTENAGRISTPVTSVGSPLSKDPQYDVHIVRHTEP
ncbi:nucleotide-binding universal stress UspA family protein [Halohasta litchfieldiae]|jgi:nucleotide-binding universal stress UspA family protein|uniref:Nucleotide-binding universal stress protein, UspA family n=1 Tax=Halohasta litchfieldiae TaxID=1073996 RepID=A0A1H6T1M5_9EURY|nr:universal stress protein [Halohasta litchfieldiae]ATW86908.1 nucleotide-binding universal stress UspA family protein [Halohasta litchfieldiae]SEI70145.1 Nucleotide-binding universal stress protein, UspA family [Halohasta litchfieldiae]